MGRITQRSARALAQLLRASRHGLATKELIILLALAALVGLLLQVQSGALDLGALAGKSAAAPKGKSKGKGGKGQTTLIENPPASSPLADAEAAYIPSRRRQMDAASLESQHILGGIANMDGRAASILLAKLDPALAAGSLARLPRRSVARILDETEPEVASAWVSAVLTTQLSAIPDELKPAAARAGLYDNSADLLAALRSAAGQDNQAAETAPASANGGTAAEAESAAGPAGGSPAPP